jgi:hypothetical protein
MTRFLVPLLAAALALPALAPPAFAADKITEEQRIALVRDLTAEYATTKESLPRSKKPLELETDGKYDQKKWIAMMRESGPAARLGDQIQITKITIEPERIVFEINGGIKSGKHWYDGVQVGMGTQTTPVGRGDATATTGTYLALEFHKPIGELDTDDVKKMLSPIFDFDKHSVTKLFVDTLPPEIKKAIADKRAQVGMSRDEVLLALGHADRKIRETKDGDEIEDWIYGTPPGKITFVTFNGEKVIKVKETYAGLGLEASKPLPVPN